MQFLLIILSVIINVAVDSAAARPYEGRFPEVNPVVIGRLDSRNNQKISLCLSHAWHTKSANAIEDIWA